MEFITDNYIVIILIAVIAVMTIIGYIADKKGFGSKKEGKNKEVKEANVENNDTPSFDNIIQPTESVVQSENTDSLSFDMPTDLEPVEETSFDTTDVSVDNASVEDSVESFDSFEQSEPALAEDTVDNGFGDFEQPSVEPVVETPEESTLEVTEPTVEDESIEDNTLEELNIEQPLDNTNFDLPSVDTLDKELKDVDNNEDDVWKF